MSSHEDPKVNEEFLEWLNKQHGEHGEVSCTRGKKHDYTGMTIKLEGKKVLIDMTEHVKGTHEEFPIKLKKGEKAVNPAASDVFSEDTSEKLNDAGKALLHRMTAKASFACKRARPDMQPIASALCTDVLRAICGTSVAALVLCKKI